jgi:hypothetical protein
MRPDGDVVDAAGIGEPAPSARRCDALVHALASLLEELLGLGPRSADEPVSSADLALAWTQTQLMWSAPVSCPRGKG